MSERTTSGLIRQSRLTLFQQNENAECGLACLAMVARYHGHDIDLASLRRRFSVSLNGATLAQLIEQAGALDLDARAVRIGMDGLGSLSMPAILHWDLNHFVVLKRASRGSVEILDPARGIVEMRVEEASRHFTGIALELSPSSGFAPIQERRPISARGLVGRLQGVGKAALQVMLMALCLELVTLALPLLLQWSLDHVLGTADLTLLSLMAIGFVAVTILQAALVAARGTTIAHLSASVHAQWLDNVFRHLLKLPLVYFEKRSVGGVLSRFTSLSAIQQTVAGSFVEALLDGLTALVVLMLLASYSPKLMLVVAASVAIYAVARWLAYRTLHSLSEEQVALTARQQGLLIEAVRGIQAIKLAGRQAQMGARVQDTTIEVASRDQAIGRNKALFGAFSKLIFGVQRIMLIWLAVRLVLGGELSTGMLVVAIGYGDLFSTRVCSLIDKVVDLRMLGLHAERLADITLEPSESQVGNAPLREVADLEIDDVSFRYGAGEPWVIRNLSFQAREGESIAIVGPSGAGKTTLAKLMLGLLTPAEGELRLGGTSAERIGWNAYRQHFGAVMQEDSLFAGSVADNITFFDSAARPQDIEEAARSACVHDEIAAMPMGYESIVGDMGSALSGGQKQRILLARALYRKPRILVLDEATSHLDVENEWNVSARLAGLRLTRIIIAHRPETILSADRILRFSHGRLVEEARENFLQSLRRPPARAAVEA